MRIYRSWAKSKVSTMLATVLGLLTLPLLCGRVLADPPPIQLQVKPQRCISLHEGQVCYQKLTFSWQTPGRGEFCLHDTQASVVLTCWRGDEKTQHEYEFESRESADFAISYKGREEALVKVKVQVASVYKSPERSNSRWRLF